MSSLAAAKADNFRYPPDYDPKKHGTLNQYHGQHALRDRARKISEGILIIRFEVPFNMWCGKCGEHIGKGVRFNAEKQAVGQYHSTKVWAFTMRHHCGGRIVIQTDPKNAEYVVAEGGRRKVEAYDDGDAGTVTLPDAAERAAVAADPLASLERATEHARAAAAGRSALAALAADREAKRDEYALGKQLRAQLRASRKEDAALDARRQQLGLPDSVRLLPANATDARDAALAMLAAGDGTKWEDARAAKRRRVMGEAIIPAAAAKAPAAAAAAVSAAAGRGGGGGGGGGGSSSSSSGKGGGGRTAAATAAAGLRGSSSNSGGSGRPQLSAAARALAARVMRGPGKIKGL